MIKKIVTSLLLILLSTTIIIVSCNFIVIQSSKDRTYDNVKDIPYRETGLLLGTSPFTRSGETNSFFTHRIDAAIELYNANKISYILVSGNGKNTKGYDEPQYMKKYLVERGIPSNIITLDKKGLRTFDSVIRARETFDLSNFTVISQRFHNERAIFIADYNNVDAIGFNAEEVTFQSAIFVKIRELFAKVKVFIDLIYSENPD